MVNSYCTNFLSCGTFHNQTTKLLTSETMLPWKPVIIVIETTMSGKLDSDSHIRIESGINMSGLKQTFKHSYLYVKPTHRFNDLFAEDCFNLFPESHNKFLGLDCQRLS